MGEATATERAEGGPTAEERATILSRAVWSVLFGGPLAVMITAAILSPDPEGHGTHTQLGLPPCGFLVMTGVSCPGCGLTTSFSHMIRADVVGAAQANPFGIMLFLVTLITIPVAGVSLMRGLPVIRTLDRLHFEKVAILLALTSLVVWGARLIGHWVGL